MSIMVSNHHSQRCRLLQKVSLLPSSSFLLLLLLLVVSTTAAAAGAVSHGPKGGVRSSSKRSIATTFVDSPLVLQEQQQQQQRSLKSKKSKKSKKGPKKRECKVSEKRNEIKFKCKSKTDKDDKGDDNDVLVGDGDTSKDDGTESKAVDDEYVDANDEIEYRVKTDKDGLKVNVKYNHEAKDDDDASQAESETQYELTFNRVIEYEKANKSFENTATAMSRQELEAYNWEKDTILQEVILSEWNQFTSIVDDTEGIVSTFSASTPDDSVTFTFTISRAEKGDKLTANKMKIDFELLNFTWTQSDSYVALISSVQSKQKIQEEEGEDAIVDVKISFEDAVDTIGFVPVGEYTWDDMANSTNTTTGETTAIRVVATSPSVTGSLEQIAFSFVGDDARSSPDIYWDPEAGVGYSEPSSAGTMDHCMASLTAGAAVVLLALVL